MTPKWRNYKHGKNDKTAKMMHAMAKVFYGLDFVIPANYRVPRWLVEVNGPAMRQIENAHYARA